MAESTKRSTSARSKSSGATAKRSSSSRPKSGGRASGSSSRARSSASRRAATKNGRSASGAGSRSAPSRGSDGVVQNANETVGTAASRAKAPLVAGGAAAAGLLGGLVLGSRVLTPRKKILGVPIARKGLDLKPVARELSRLTDEVAQARKKAKKVGDALS